MLASYNYNKIGDRDDQGNILLHLTDIWATQVFYYFTQMLVYYISHMYAPGAMRYVGYDTELGNDFDKDGIYGN